MAPLQACSMGNSARSGLLSRVRASPRACRLRRHTASTLGCAQMPRAAPPLAASAPRQLLPAPSPGVPVGQHRTGATPVGPTPVLFTGVEDAEQLETEVDARGLLRLQLREDGYQTWMWQGHKVNYVAMGPGPDAGPALDPPLVFIHGFGASVYHWRYNLPELAKHGRVYALDLLGFGWSDKALVEYSAALWRQLVSDFVQQVVGQPAVLVGNSVGGYTSLSTAAFHPDEVLAVVLVNAAGRFKTPQTEPPPSDTEADGQPQAGSAWAWVSDRVQGLIKRVGLYVAFQQAKQPARIQQVLKTVYADHGSVDSELVRSIVIPTTNPNAQEVYYRLVTQVLLHPSALPVNDLLDRIKARSNSSSDGDAAPGSPAPGTSSGSPSKSAASEDQLLSPLPMLLLWGVLDPWCTPDKADTIQSLYPNARRVDVRAGHCPHDEAPVDVNHALLEWWKTLSV